MASCFDTLWHIFSPAETYTIDHHTYTVVSRLGEGGFAVVDLVESSRDGRRYALKRILLQSNDARMVRPLFCYWIIFRPLFPSKPHFSLTLHFNWMKLGELELSMLRKLDHPGIVRLHGSSRISSGARGQPDQLLLLLDYFPVRTSTFTFNLIRCACIDALLTWNLSHFLKFCFDASYAYREAHFRHTLIQCEKHAFGLALCG